MAMQDLLRGPLGNIAVLLIGTIAGYFISVKLFRMKLQDGEQSKKRRTIASIINELQKHESSLKTHPRYEYVKSNEVRLQPFSIYPDQAFKESISNGMFHLFSTETQRMLVEYYHNCDMINALQKEGISSLIGAHEINYTISMINRYLELLKPDEILNALKRETIT